MKSINTLEAKAAFDKGTQFIDVREVFEHDEVRIPGSILIPLSEMNSRYKEIPKADSVVIYCHTGSRSTTLLFQLNSMGYDNLINLEGGIMNWMLQQHPVQRGNQKVENNSPINHVDIA